jgi:hypothetical protein
MQLFWHTLDFDLIHGCSLLYFLLLLQLFLLHRGVDQSLRFGRVIVATVRRAGVVLDCIISIGDWFVAGLVTTQRSDIWWWWGGLLLCNSNMVMVGVADLGGEVDRRCVAIHNDEEKLGRITRTSDREAEGACRRSTVSPGFRAVRRV